MCVAVVGTGAAGVKDSLFRSGSSSDLRRRGELPRVPEGEAGFELDGERLPALRAGMGSRKLGCLDDDPACCCWELCWLPCRSGLGEPC